MTAPCAYCRRPTPPERQAAAPWRWPGRGLVTNCVDCAGLVPCAEVEGCRYDSTLFDACPVHAVGA